MEYKLQQNSDLNLHPVWDMRTRHKFASADFSMRIERGCIAENDAIITVPSSDPDREIAGRSFLFGLSVPTV